MHVFSLTLMMPTVAGLLLCLAWVLYEMGGYCAERRQMLLEKDWEYMRLLQELGRSRNDKPLNWEEILLRYRTPPIIKSTLMDFIATPVAFTETRKIIARRVLEQQEEKAQQVLDRTDILAKVGPMLGLIGTLIPLGPGLAALGSGDVSVLAQAVIVAFDTTVTGLVIGGLAFWITRMRQRRFEKYLAMLEAVLETMLEVLENATPKSKTNVAAIERRSDERAC
jgi:biopolymer transport protein ExbB/TolQ